MLDFGEELFEAEDVLTVIKDLSHPCFDCRLGHCQKKPGGRGLIWRGNPKARIALVSTMPGPQEVELGQPLVGASGKESDTWFKYLQIDTNKDTLVINVVQCKPPDVEKAGDNGKKETSQREPEIDEMAACFPGRCLRLLKAMPNLEVVVTLGWTAAKCLLGGTPGEPSHMGHWYVSSLLPGKAIFCLPHPAALLREKNKHKKEDKEVSDAYLQKKYKIIHALDKLRRAYIDSDKITQLAKEGV